MKVAFTTLGCRVNVYETEAMSELFIKEGHEIIPFNKIADVYIINTCTVTNMGDKKSRQMINRARRKNENAVIAVVGCYSQIAPKEISSIEGVDIVLGTRNKSKIVHYVNRFIEEKKQIIKVDDVLHSKIFDDLSIEEYQYKTRAFLKIQDGCNRFCSYCLIPYARGAVCSKEPEKVIEEVHKLAEHGFKEIILSGIHIASYGFELKDNWSLIKILEEVNNVEGIERIRIGSIDPTFFTKDVIKNISNMDKVCPHFHLSLQSGCDETLKRMNRRYSTSEYRAVVQNLRKHIKDISITTDVIVGFPGETDYEFNKTYEFLKEIELSKMHIFKYSPRSRTKAAKMQCQVDGKVKDIRSHKLIELNEKLEKQFMQKYIGRTMEVLYEQKSKEHEGYYEGYTPNYIRVLSKINYDALIGKVLPTKLYNVDKEFMYGTVNF